MSHVRCWVSKILARRVCRLSCILKALSFTFHLLAFFLLSRRSHDDDDSWPHACNNQQHNIIMYKQPLPCNLHCLETSSQTATVVNIETIMSAAAILLRSSSSSAVGRNIIRRLQKTSALSSAYRALECNVHTNIPNYRSNTREFSSKETVTITYCDPDGTEHSVEAEIGKHLLDVAHDNNIELEGKFIFLAQGNQYHTKRTTSNMTIFWNDSTIEFISQEHVVENLHAQLVILCLNKKCMMLFHQSLMRKRIC